MQPTDAGRGTRSLADWLEILEKHLSPKVTATSAEQEVLLDLARVAAHGSERIAAPITTFLVGVAFADLAPEERAARIGELARRLELVPDP